jgi:Holliday junction resolvasome RuvABC endonuclease subunit
MTKPAKYLIAIDPASNRAGVAVIALTEPLMLISVYPITASGTTWSERFASIYRQVRKIKFPPGEYEFAIEKMPALAHFGLAASAGPVVAAVGESGVCADVTKMSYIAPTSWKAVARKFGCKDKSPKGVKALRFINPEWADACNGSDDVADACLIAFAWCVKQKFLTNLPKAKVSGLI